MKTLYGLASLLLIFTITITACGVATPAPTGTPTTAPSLTPSFTPTNTKLPPTPSGTSTPTPIPVVAPPDGLHMAFVIDGNLYFQEGSNPRIQLTNSGKDHFPFFSEDGQKLIFYRGKSFPTDLYSYDIQEQVEHLIVSNGPAYATFLPRSHQLLYSTAQSDQENITYIADTDTGKIRKLPYYLNDFNISPDAKYVADDGVGNIFVSDLGGNFRVRRLVSYTPSQPSFLPPGIMWEPDSKGLIILLPVRTNFDLGYISEFTVWRYTLNDGKGIQVPLDILPTEGKPGMVSPDGKWILYNSTENHYGFYLADLNTGHAELYASEGYISYYWSSDSEHFIYSNGDLYLGSINGSPQRIGDGDFLGWIDSSRYFYYIRRENIIMLGNIDGNQSIVSIHIPETFSPKALFTFILPQVLSNP